MRWDIQKKDREYIWHPYTQMKDCVEMPNIPIERAEGAKLFDYDGNFYYDTISSWWCNIHGHNHPYIKKAIKKQLDKMEHVLFAGFTHEKAVDLAERLVKLSPRGLNKVFFSDNGSTSVEVAMKMSFQFWKNRGYNVKRSFISLEGAYHGDTLAAMSVSGVSIFNECFAPLMFDTFKAAPPCYNNDGTLSPEDLRDRVAGSLSEIDTLLKRHAAEVCAIIAEPILMGAGGMKIYPPEYLKGIRELSSSYDVHLIADEVATGFGRTGTLFACDQAGITPDFMCVSKAITSGYLPLGATMTTDEIFDAFYADYSDMKTFYHGHTFTANPLACAAAVASLDLLNSENSMERVSAISSRLKGFLREMRDVPSVSNARGIGVVGAFDIVKKDGAGQVSAARERQGQKIYKAGLKNGILLRPLGDVIYFFLPYCITDTELDDIFDRTRETIKSALR